METRGVLAVCMVWWCAGLPIVEMSNSGGNDTIKISIFNRRYVNGHLVAKVAFEEDYDKWEFNIDHFSDKPIQISTGKFPKPLYDFFPGLGYYKLHTLANSWHQGKITCEKEGAHLMVINSQAEVEVVQELRRRLPRLRGDWLDDILLIGMNDIEIEGTWKTIFNETLEKAGFAVWGCGTAWDARGLWMYECTVGEIARLWISGCFGIFV